MKVVYRELGATIGRDFHPVGIGATHRLIKLCSAVLLVIVGSTQFASKNSLAGTMDEWERIDAQCTRITPPAKKIERCVKLLADSRIPRNYLALINGQIAWAFSDLKQYSKSIEHKLIDISLAQDELRRNHSTGDALRANLNAISGRYEELGMFYALDRLSRLVERSDEAHKSAEQERLSYLSALKFNPRNYKAYMRLAEIESLLCDSLAASSHQDTALKLAVQADDDRAVREYKYAILPTCIPDWRASRH